MAKRKQTSLEQDIAELRREREASFNEPRFTLGAITAKLGISETAVRNWLTRRQLNLSANQGRAEGKWRNFSIRDAIILSVAFQLSRLGMPPSAFAPVAEKVAEIAGRLEMEPMASPVPLPSMIIRNDGQWSFEADPSRADAPAAAIVLNVEKVIRDTVEPLGLVVTRGTAKDHARAAKQITKGK